MNIRFVLSIAVSALLFVGCFGGGDDKKRVEDRPDVLLIVVDDLGFADLSPYGSEILTPAVQALADTGVSFSRFHTSSMGSATRSMLLTGVDNHLNGFGTVAPLHTANQYMKDGYETYLNRDVATIAEVLEAQGYATAMVGKWALGVGAAHSPKSRGFQRSFALQGSGAHHFASAVALNAVESEIAFYSENGVVVDSLPADFYSSKFFAEKMSQYIKETPKSKPFFGYLSFTAPRAPLQVEAAWQDRAKGRYDAGDVAVRQARLERQVELGLFPESVLEQRYDSQNVAWQWLSTYGRELEIRKMEIYAAMVEYLDNSIGQVVEELKRSGRYDNTLIIVMSDNGASAESAVYYANIEDWQAWVYKNGVDNIGNEDSFVALGSRWVDVCNAPFTLGKATMGQGGIASPLIISGGAIKSERKMGRMDSGNILHVSDIVPTILDYTESVMLDEFRGVDIASPEGRSLRGAIERTEIVRQEDEPLCFEMLEGKAVIMGNWKARCLAPPYGNGRRWELFDLREDPMERTNLAYSNREKLNEMVAQWDQYGERVGYIRAIGTRPYISLIGAKRYFGYDTRLRR
ncbi:MAG: arylsulfatase [Rikenellaceae bacterium]